MVPTAFKLNIKKDVKEHWTQVERLLKSSDTHTVVNACDAGREGELIFRYAYQYAKCNKPIERLWISSLEDSAIVQGWKNLKGGSTFDALAQNHASRPVGRDTGCAEQMVATAPPENQVFEQFLKINTFYSCDCVVSWYTIRYHTLLYYAILKISDYRVV